MIRLRDLLKNIFQNCGYQITRLTKEQFDPQFEGVYQRCKNYTMTNKERMFALYQAVEYIIKNNIPGDFVECGVWKGGSCMLMAEQLKRLNCKGRKIYLYDTFVGMTPPIELDKMIVNNALAFETWKNRQLKSYNAWCFSPLEEVQKNLISTGYPAANIIFIKGKVEDTLLNQKPPKIALLRLDTDWYESTKAELTYLYPLLVNGGVLILDDYGTWSGAKKAVDDYLNLNKIFLLLNRIDEGARMTIKLKAYK